MALMNRALKSLLPAGSPWRLPAVFRSVIGALALSLDRLKVFIDAIVTESLPSAAVDTLPDWYEALGLAYDPALALDVRQAIARQAYTAVGGQSLDSLQAALTAAHPDLTVSTVTPDGHKYYNLSGYTDPDTLDRALGLMDQIAPAEMEPHVDVITFQRITTDGAIRVTSTGAIRGGR
jgi:uncharacterized protein YmfQ (DUF2313 family)